MNQQIDIVAQRYRDITNALADDSLDEIRKHDVIRGVIIRGIMEEHHDRVLARIGHFYHEEYRIRGRIFPQDEIIRKEQAVDIIVQNWRREQKLTFSNLDVQVYHDFYTRERIPVRISRIGEGRDPSFKFFNYITGFLKPFKNPSLYRAAKVGDALVVEVVSLNPKGTRQHVITIPVSFLQDAW